MDEPGVAQRAADTFARLLQRGVREPDDREPGQTGRDVDLDQDQPAVEAVERGGRDDGQHVPSLRSSAYPAVNRRSTDAYRGPPSTSGQRAGTTAPAATGLSIARAKLSSDEPRAESAFVNMNGAPELRARIAR